MKNDMSFQDYVSIWAIFETLLLMALLRFLVKLYKARVRIATLKRQGLVWHFCIILIA